jgi:hypothetical protein
MVLYGVSEIQGRGFAVWNEIELKFAFLLWERRKCRAQPTPAFFFFLASTAKK